MNKALKLIIATFLCSSLITTSVLADELGNKKEDSNKIKQEITNNKDKIKELESNKNDIFKEIENLNSNIRVLTDEVYNLNFKINEVSTTIAGLEEKSEKLKLDLEKNKEIMSKRLKALYMSQGQGYVEVLFESKGLADFIEKLEIITTLIKYDKGVIGDFKKNQDELDATLKEVAVEKESLENDRVVVQGKLDELNSKKSEKDILMAKAEEDINTQERIIAQKESEFEQIVAIISKMETQQRPSRGYSRNTGGGQVSNGNHRRTSLSNYLRLWMENKSYYGKKRIPSCC